MPNIKRVIISCCIPLIFMLTCCTTWKNFKANQKNTTSVSTIKALEEKKLQRINAVPAVPNESIIRGEVWQFSILNANILGVEPEQTLYMVRVKIRSSESIKGMANFTRDKVGQVIGIYSKDKISADVFGTVVKCRITYRGDEGGGNFWLMGNGLEIINNDQNK